MLTTNRYTAHALSLTGWNVLTVWIEEELYRKIRGVMPIPVVDAITTHRGKLLLMLRNNPPVKDILWVPGGRIMRGESLEEAVLRKLHQETGLEGRIVRRVGVINHIFPDVHMISIFFNIETEDDKAELNEEHRAYKWVSKIPKDSHPYLKRIVVQALGNQFLFDRSRLRKRNFEA